ADRIDQMARGDVPGVASAVNEHLAFARADLLHDDLCLLPAIGARRRREREQDGLAARQEMRAVGGLSHFQGDEGHRSAAVRRHAQDAAWSLTKDDPVAVPAHAERIRGWAQRDGRAAIDADPLKSARWVSIEIARALQR